MNGSPLPTPPLYNAIQKFFGLFLLLCFGLLLTFCESEPRQDSDEGIAEWPNAVTYEVFVHSFADGSGDGIGDFQGLISKLDYLDDLGVQALWLMPIHPSPTYHKYDVTDYRAIHPDYGTMDDFEEFLEEAHARDIRVVIDFVVNHTSSEHPWFVDAIENPDGHFYDFYIWESEENIDNMTVDYTGPDTDNVQRWNEADGTDEYFYAYFWSGMPDLNYDNPAVRDSIYDIGKYWLEKGVDGFRLDAARHIYPEHREDENPAFWEEFRAEMESVNEDVLLVGEVWAETEEVKPYLTGLPSLFNFDMGYAMMEAAETGNGTDVAPKHAGILDAYATVTDDFIDATFLTNHDQERVMSTLDDENKARVAANMLFTLPGAPYIYYGEEIGMYGEKPDPNIREPMLWNEQPDDIRTTWKDPEYSTDETVTPVSVQLEDENSLLHHYKELIELRNTQPALTYGGLEPVEAFDDELSVFVRTHEEGNLLVIHNVSGESHQLTLTDELEAYEEIIYQSDDGFTFDSHDLTLQPHSSVVLGISGESDASYGN